MSKQWRRLTFKSLQLLHIGMGGYGVFSPTRLFIPGYTMWGALIAALGRFLGKTESELNLDPFVEISNFYPVLNEKICFPEYKDGALFFGDMSEKEFRRDYTDTMLLTSIDPASQAARETSLHEIEVLLPARKGNAQNILKWSGIIFVDLEEVIPVDNLRLSTYLKNGLMLQVGGERTYGLGLLYLEEIKDLESEIFVDWNVAHITKNEIDLKGKSAHSVDISQIDIIKGKIETINQIMKKGNLHSAQFFISHVYAPGCVGENIVGMLYKGIIR